MCTHRRYITNPYARNKRVLVDCGHCPSCLQKKADAKARLISLHSMRSGKVCIFSTLTYSNKCVPYVNIHNFDRQCASIPVWRNSKFMKPKVGEKFNKSYLLYGLYKLADVNLYDYQMFTCKNLKSLASLHYFSPQDIAVRPTDKSQEINIKLNNSPITSYESVVTMPIQKMEQSLGVLYYPDVQLFFNRLRQRYFHKFGKRADISTWITGEYGGDTHRPHFHILLWCSSDDAKWFLQNIAPCWPYGSSHRTKKYTEIARDCSAYVSKYLNGHTFVSPFLRTFFPPKSSKSIYFAYDCRNYDYWKVLSMFLRGNYEEKFVPHIESGCLRETSVLLPSRVINRFFPRFFGDSTLDDIALRWFIQRPSQYQKFCESKGLTNFDLKKHISSLLRGFSRYVDATGNNSWDDYTDIYIRVWRNFRSFALRHALEKNDKLRVPLLSQFDNLNDVYLCKDRVHKYPLFASMSDEQLKPYIDFNNLPYIKHIDSQKKHYFDTRIKLDSFNNEVYYALDDVCGL